MDSLFSLVAKLTLDITEYSRGLSDAQKQIQDTANAIKKNADSAKKTLEDSGSGAKTFSEKIADAGKSVSDFGKKVQEISAPLGELGSNLTKKLTLPIAGAFGAGTKAAIDFEGGLKKAYTIADQSKVPYDEMASALKNLSSESGVGLGELTDGLYSALSASVDTEGAVDFLSTAVNLSKAGFLETEGAVDVLTTALNAYGRSSEDAQLIADQLVLTQNDGKTTVDELASSMGMVIPTAAALNVPLEQLTAAYAQMTKQGINTANATTNLNGMMGELADGGSTVGEILKEKTGKTFGELEASGMSLGDVLQILSDSVDGNSEDFLNLWGNVRAGRGALSLLNGGIDEYNAEVDKMYNATGQVDGALETLEGTGTSLKKALNQLVLVGEDIGERFAPYIQTAADKLKELMDKWDNLDKDTQDMIIKGALVVAAIGPIISIIAGIGGAIGTVITIMGGMTTFVGASFLPGLATIIPAVAPFLVGGAIVAGVIAAVTLIVKHWDDIKKGAANLVEGVKKKWNEFKDKTKELVEDVKKKWDDFKENTARKFGEIKDSVEKKWSETKEKVASIAGELKDDAIEKWSELKENVSEAVGDLKENISEKWADIKERTGDLVENAKEGFGNFKENAVNAFSNFKDSAFEKMSSANETVKDIMGQITGRADFEWNLPEIGATPLETAQNTARWAFDSIKNLISFTWGLPEIGADVLDTAKDAVGNFVDNILDSFDGIHLSLPDIQLPHLSVSWEDLGPISIPHISVDWYAKAYENPWLFTSPTVIGGKGFGDGAGGEIVYGHENLMDDIREAMNSPVILIALQKIINAVKDVSSVTSHGQTTLLNAVTALPNTVNTIGNTIQAAIKNTADTMSNRQGETISTITTFASELFRMLENAFEKQDAILESLRDSMGMANGVLGRTYAIENFYSGPHEVYTEEVSLGELMVKIFDEIEDIGFDVYVILRHLYGGLGGFHEAIREDLQSFAPQIVLDTGKLVGELAPAMDSSLGVISARKGRYN